MAYNESGLWQDDPVRTVNIGGRDWDITPGTGGYATPNYIAQNPTLAGGTDSVIYTDPATGRKMGGLVDAAGNFIPASATPYQDVASGGFGDVARFGLIAGGLGALSSGALADWTAAAPATTPTPPGVPDYGGAPYDATQPIGPGALDGAPAAVPAAAPAPATTPTPPGVPDPTSPGPAEPGGSGAAPVPTGIPPVVAAPTSTPGGPGVRLGVPIPGEGGTDGGTGGQSDPSRRGTGLSIDPGTLGLGALGLGGLAALQNRAGNKLSGEIRDIVAPLRAEQTRLLGQYDSGEIPAWKKYEIDKWRRSSEAGWNQYFSRMGTPDSSAQTETNIQVEAQAVAMNDRARQDILTQALQISGQVTGPLIQAAVAGAQSDQAFANSIAQMLMTYAMMQSMNRVGTTGGIGMRGGTGTAGDTGTTPETDPITGLPVPPGEGPQPGDTPQNPDLPSGDVLGTPEDFGLPEGLGPLE